MFSSKLSIAKNENFTFQLRPLVSVLVVNLCTVNYGFFFLKRKAKGIALLEQAFQHLDLIEKDYFGLQYADAYGPSGLVRCKITCCREPFMISFSL